MKGRHKVLKLSWFMRSMGWARVEEGRAFHAMINGVEEGCGSMIGGFNITIDYLILLHHY
jgi:hypothetical protein